MSLFVPPVIGPFVEPNGLSGDLHTGAAISWTSNGDAFHLDVVRVPGHSIFRDRLGFLQTQSMGFEQFLWNCFEHSTRLTEFLNELQPYFKPGGGAPTLAEAGRWLNPYLVGKGFSLGIAKIREGNIIRIPVVWVFGGKVSEYGSKSVYSRVDFIDWTPSGSKLLRRLDCWGTGAPALKRLLHQLVDTMAGPLLTEAGEARMQQMLEWSRPKAKTRKPVKLLSKDERSLAADLRVALHHLDRPLPGWIANQIDQLSEKSYGGILRACAWRGLERAACALLEYRALPEVGREKLLQHFIGSDWNEVWKFCQKEVGPCLSLAKPYGYNKLMTEIVERGKGDMLKSVLALFSHIDVNLAASLVQSAFESGRISLVDIIVSSVVVQQVKEAVLLRAFVHSLSGYRQDTLAAIHLMELGVRPVQAIDKEDAILVKSLLLRGENFPVLKHALKLDPPTNESIAKLLDGFSVEPGKTFDWLCNVSKDIPGHKDRMDKVAFNATVAFMRRGSEEHLMLLDRALEEGGTLKNVPWNSFKTAGLLTGHHWREEEGNWIDLIAHLLKKGLVEDAALLKRLRRPKRKE